VRSTIWIPLVLTTLSLALIGALPVPRQQSDVDIDQLEVALWPEFDRPAVLVIYQARLSEAVELPAVVQLPIPAGVGEPHAVATRGSDERLVDAAYQRQVEGDWAVIQIEAPNREVWLEYYDDLQYEGAERRYVFTWPGDTPVGSLLFEVLRPVFAGDLLVSPAGQVSEDAEGRTSVHGDLGPQSRSSSAVIELEYQSELGTRPATDQLPPSDQTFEVLDVALWPEYDRTAVLVFYRVRLPQELPLPTQVQLPIPADVGEPHAVATRSVEGGLFDAKYEREVYGEWALISVETASRDLWLEFYDELVQDGAGRSYALLWPGGIGLDAFKFEVQQPVGATGVLISPAASPQIGEDSFIYYRGGLTPEPTDSALLVGFHYTKETSELSVDAEAPRPGLTRPQATRGGTPDLTSALPWFIGGLGAVLLLGGAVYYIRQRRPPAPGRSPRRRRKKSPPKEHLDEVDASPTYCHACGTQASVSDRYCRRCGTRLRQ
jgi:hypothetical protein